MNNKQLCLLAISIVVVLFIYSFKKNKSGFQPGNDPFANFIYNLNRTSNVGLDKNMFVDYKGPSCVIFGENDEITVRYTYFYFLG